MTQKYSSKDMAAPFLEEVESKEKGVKTVTYFKFQCGTFRTQGLKRAM
jgi:hypothetical protein